MISGHNIIAGSHSAEGPHTFTSVDPRTKTAGSIRFHNATAGETDRAVRAAQAAYGTLRTLPAARLAELLEAIASEIEALGDELLQTADMETALGLPRLTGERGRTTGQLRAFAGLLREGSYVEAIIDRALPDRQPAPRPDIRRMLFPIGPVAVFAASNFPFAFSVAGGDTASALAAGCPVVLKAHPGHPATSELVAGAINRAVARAGLPAGTFSLLQGERIEVGQGLVQHPGIEAVGFTGSLRAGRAIYDAAAARPKPIPVYAEMGSVNPVFVLPGAIRARAETLAEGLSGSVMLGGGQFCTNPGLVLAVDGPETQAFITLVKERMAAQPEHVLLNAGIERGLAAAVATTRERPAVKTLLGGEAPVDAPAYCYRSTVLQTTASALLEDAALQVEHFGPVTLFVLCRDMAQMQQAAGALHGALTATIHAEADEVEAAGPLAAELREKAGRLIWNDFPTGVEVVHSMQHGGPYPATTAPATTSVGMTAIKRFMRPVAYQNMPAALLPAALQDDNPLGIMRIVDGQHTRAALG